MSHVKGVSAGSRLFDKAARDQKVRCRADAERHVGEVDIEQIFGQCPRCLVPSSFLVGSRVRAAFSNKAGLGGPLDDVAGRHHGIETGLQGAQLHLVVGQDEGIEMGVLIDKMNRAVIRSNDAD